MFARVGHDACEFGQVVARGYTRGRAAEVDDSRRHRWKLRLPTTTIRTSALSYPSCEKKRRALKHYVRNGMSYSGAAQIFQPCCP